MTQPSTTDLFLRDNSIFVRHNQLCNNRQTLIFLHGLSGSISAWIPFAKFFDADFNVFQVDLRGHGKSRKYGSQSDYQIERYADDIRLVIDSFQLVRPILVAHSFGCLGALQYILQENPNVGKVVFMSAQFNLKNHALDFLLSLVVKCLRPFNKVTHAPSDRQHLDYAKYPAYTDYDVRRMSADIFNTGLFGYLSCLLETTRRYYKAQLPQVIVPVLFIHGQNDSIFLARNIPHYQHLIPNAQASIIAGANHVLVFTHISELCQSIKNFSIQQDVHGY